MNNYEALTRLSTIDLQQYGDDPFGDGMLTPLYACDCYREEFVTLLKSIDKLEKYKWHDLRENPYDFPEKEELVTICYADNSEDNNKYLYSVGYFDDTSHWEWLGNHEDYLEIIGWKYIEGFDDDHV